MKLILDCRERDLKLCCETLIKTNENFKNIIIETGNLELGDMIIRDDNGIDLIIYERKAINDLIASIKDGRYTEQSYRLNGLNHHNHNIIYLIEGSISKALKDKQMVYSSIFSINYYKGFSVMRSSNMEETAYVICNAIMKIAKEKDKKAFYGNTEELSSESEKPEVSYSSVIKSKKNSNVTPENIGEIILCQIPSVNSVSAVCIMKKFKTISSLIQSIKEDDKCLNDITYETEKKQTRKISKTVIANIIAYLKN